MPCILDSCELTDLKVKIPDYRANAIEPLLIQFNLLIIKPTHFQG